MDGKVNSVLNAVMQKIYMERKPLPDTPRTVVRYEKVQDRVFSEMWFMTPGCSHDKNGGCTMCNYGKGHFVDRREILQEMEWKIKELPENLQELIVTPTGSMLDEQEVSMELLADILKLLESVVVNDFSIETRADTISEEKLNLVKQYIHADRIFIETGVEVCNNWILRNCVNKDMDMEDLGQALRTIHSMNMYACANIGIGIPFLSERMSIRLAADSVRTAFEMGFDSVVLFPYHIKPGTLSSCLWEMGEYKCCSLWALIEVLGMLPEEKLEQVYISWYRNYYEDPKKILLSPDTCDVCREEALTCLDAYKNYPGKKAREKLLSLSCECRDIWKQELLSQPDDIDADGMAEIYRRLGKRFEIHKDIVEQEIIYMSREYRRGGNV